MSLSEEISFNGITLQSAIADAHVLDIQIYAIPLDLTTVSRAYGPGSILAKKRDEARTVEIDVELPVDYRDGIATQYNALRSWADSDEPCALILPNSVGTLYAMLTDMTELSMASWYEPIVLTFTAFDPYFYADETSFALEENGRNILPDTRTMSTWYQSLSTLNLYIDDEGFGVLQFPGSTAGVWRYFYSRGYGDSTSVIPYSLVRNKTVTMSFDVRAPDDDLIVSALSPSSKLAITPSTSDTTVVATYNRNTPEEWGLTEVTAEWQRATATFAITDDLFTEYDNFSDDCGFCLNLQCATAQTGTLEYRRPKLEIGTVATDWSPAPEDGEATSITSSFTVGGDVSATYTITATNLVSFTDPSWSFDGGSWVIALSGSIGAGTIVIDTETGLITLNGDGINSSIDMDSRFERLTVGDHTVTSSIVSTITWQEAYR